jgi:hypothetical protein
MFGSIVVNLGENGAESDSAPVRLEVKWAAEVGIDQHRGGSEGVLQNLESDLLSFSPDPRLFTT